MRWAKAGPIPGREVSCSAVAAIQGEDAGEGRLAAAGFRLLGRGGRGETCEAVSDAGGRAGRRGAGGERGRREGRRRERLDEEGRLHPGLTGGYPAAIGEHAGPWRAGARRVE